jgi:Pyrimidine dimer DNA glycosylase/Protein of unknown function (DUF1722)
MRIWDINPGYLNRGSLLGEHRELHGMVSIFLHNKKGYSRHPETLRWVGFGWALRQRHQLLAAEMALRGYNDRSPVTLKENTSMWPKDYIDEPFRQYEILREKYRDKEQGRIPFPKNAQQLWSHHKYSVLARDVSLYKKIGKDSADIKSDQDYSQLVELLTGLLRTPPSIGDLRNAIQHMWGHVSDYRPAPKGEVESWSLSKLLDQTQQRAIACNEPYLTCSTALSELMAWIP